MRETTLVKLWSQVSRTFLPRGATARETETAQNAFLAGALGVFLDLEHAIESHDEAVIAAALKDHYLVPRTLADVQSPEKEQEEAS